MYEKDYFGQYGTTGRSYCAQSENPTFAKRLRELKALGISSGRILDIGCAFGFFLAMAEASGFGVCGVDVSRHALREARRSTRGLLLWLDHVHA